MKDEEESFARIIKSERSFRDALHPMGDYNHKPTSNEASMNFSMIESQS